MRRMAGRSAGAAKIQIPRWIQLVGLPLAAARCCGWSPARRVTSSSSSSSPALIAFLLNPIVRTLTRRLDSRAGSASRWCT